MVNLSLTAKLTKPNRIRLSENTPAYSPENQTGFGAPNIARSDVSRYRLSLAYSGGNPYIWEVDGGPNGDFAKGKLSITAGQLALWLAGDTCSQDEGVASVFRSGCLVFSARAMGKTTITRYHTNYLIQLTVALPAGFQVWVRKEGIWTDITTFGASINSGPWRWQNVNTLDLYTDYEVRRGRTVVDGGTVLKQVLETTGTVRQGEETVVGEGQVSFFISVAERLRWAKMVLRWVQNNPTTHAHGYDLGQHPKKSSPACGLALIGQTLTLLDTKNDLDCRTGTTLLTSINAQMDEWER